jgi:hypothetical protein
MKITHFDANYPWNLGNTVLSQGGGVPADTGNSGSGGGGGGAPTGAAGGDLGGSYPNPTVVGIQGTPVDALPSDAKDALNGLGHWTRFVTAFGGGQEVYQTIAALGATHTLDLANGNGFDATLTANCTLIFAGATAGTLCSFMLLLRQDGTGGWTTTWPGSVIWAGGSAPTLDTTLSTATVLTFFSLDGGTVWYGFPTGASGSVSPLTTKGDLYTFSTVDARLGVGADGRTLLADSSQTTGLRWSSTAPVGPILISDTPSTPLVFADLIQNDAQTDLVYADL